MWTVLIRAKGLMLLGTCVCLLLLLGPVAQNRVEGADLWSPCPDVYAHHFDSDSKQWVGWVYLRGVRYGQKVRLKVDLAIGGITVKDTDGTIKLVKTGEELLSDIKNNLPVVYRIDIALKSVIPIVTSIKFNDQTVCASEYQLVDNKIRLSHSFTALMPPVLSYYSSNGNVNSQPIQTQGPGISYGQTPMPVVSTAYVTVKPQTVVQTARPSEYFSYLNYSSSQELTTQRPQTVTSTLPPVQSTRTSMTLSSMEEGIGCGRPAQVLNHLSINGTRTRKGQFPWASPIFDISGSIPRYICGSTIITKMHLVTAAHCMYVQRGEERAPKDILTVPGMYNIDNFFDEDLQERIVVRIVIHDEYFFEETELTDSDIAVMKVDQPIVYNDLVRPICLWSESNNLEQIVGLEGYVSGWGITESGEAKYPSYVTATIVDKRACANNLEKLFVGSSRLFCGDGHGSVPCNGDSGSGFVIKRGPKYFLRGVVSIGQFDPNTLTCARDKYVLYTDVAPLRYWLSKVVKGT